MRGFVRRHVGVLLAVLLSPTFVELGPPKEVRPRVVLPEHEARIVEFSPDSRVMVTDGDSGGCVRDAATGRVLVRLMKAGSNGPSPATEITWPRFTADGRHLIVQLGGPRFGPELTRTVTLAIFEVATGRELASFEGARYGNLAGSRRFPPRNMLFRRTDRHWRSAGRPITRLRRSQSGTSPRRHSWPSSRLVRPWHLCRMERRWRIASVATCVSPRHPPRSEG